MKLRLAQISDLSEILKLFEETIKLSCSNDYSPEQIKAWTASIKSKDKWLKRVKEQHFLTAEESGSLVGFASLVNGNYIDLMYVHPDFQDHGIAKTLLAHLLKKVQGDSVSTHASITARPFFERNGFKVVQENKFELRGVEMMNFEMALYRISP